MSRIHIIWRLTIACLGILTLDKFIAMKNKTDIVCRNHDGELIDTYASREEAEQQIRLNQLMHRITQNSYGCLRCEGWHLCPGDREPCEHCKKMGYSTVKSAEKVVRQVLKKSGIHLSRYHCPLGNGWHLTKKPLSF